MEAEAIAAHLLGTLPQKSRTNPPDLAFLRFEDTICFASYSRERNEPSSAILKLIQGIYELEPKKARLVLRNRIFSTAATTELCHGAVKVAAKRIHAELVPISHSQMSPGFHWVDAGQVRSLFAREPLSHPYSLLEGKDSPRSHTDFLTLAAAIRDSRTQREGPRYQRDREVAALLVSKDGEILSFGINCNHSNRTLHAELNMIQNFYARLGSGIPRGSRVYVTLKPCKMCAGAIWVAAEDPFSIEVYYSEFDPGRNARWTVLDVGSEERKRVARNAREREAVLQQPWP